MIPHRVKQAVAPAALASLLALLLALLGVTGGAAHAALEASSPPEGAVVAEAPAAVTVRFTEPLERSYSQLQLFDSAGEAVPGTTLRAGDDEYTMVLDLPPGLPDGTYSVLWRTLSTADGHPAQNYFAFTVGAGEAVGAVAVPSAAADAGGPAQGWQTASRWAAFAGLALLVAAWPLWAAIVRPALAPAWRVAPAVTPRMRRLALAATVLAVVGSLFALVVQSLTLPDGALPARVWDTLADTRYGELWLSRMGLIVLAGSLLATAAWWYPRRRPVRTAALWGASLALPLPFSLIAHASAQPAGRPVAIAADALHLLAACLWGGGLAVLALVLLPGARALPPERRRVVLGTAIARFSVLGIAAWGVMGLTGAYAAWLHVGSLEALRETAYGRALVVKLALLAVALALAAVNLLVIERRMRRAAVQHVPAWSRRLRWTVAAEAALVLVALGAVGQMTSLQPAREAVTSPDATTILFDTPDGEARLTVEPGVPGVNAFRLDVPEGMAGEETEALLRFTIPARTDLGQSEVTLTRRSETVWEYRGSEISMAGDWAITMILREPGAAPVSATVDHTFGEPTGSGGDAPWRFGAPGGLAALALVVAGSIALGVAAVPGTRARKLGGVAIGVVALALGGALLLQVRLDPALVPGPWRE